MIIIGNVMIHVNVEKSNRGFFFVSYASDLEL